MSPSGRREQPLPSFPLFCPPTPSCRSSEASFLGCRDSFCMNTDWTNSPEDVGDVTRPAACPPWRLCLPHFELCYQKHLRALERPRHSVEDGAGYHRSLKDQRWVWFSIYLASQLERRQSSLVHTYTHSHTHCLAQGLLFKV